MDEKQLKKRKLDVQERGKALEDEFFRRQEDAAIERIRAAKARERTVSGLRDETGISDAEVLEALVEAGVDPSTAPALSLVPLAAVAWASGRVEPAERAAVERAARECGLVEGSPAQLFLAQLLAEPIDDSLLAAWEAYAGALADSIGEMKRTALGLGIARWARRIAEAAGGFLGIGSVSSGESLMLTRIEAAFGLKHGD